MIPLLCTETYIIVVAVSGMLVSPPTLLVGFTEMMLEAYRNSGSTLISVIVYIVHTTE